MRKRSVRLERRRYTALPRAEKQPEKQPERIDAALAHVSGDQPSRCFRACGSGDCAGPLSA